LTIKSTSYTTLAHFCRPLTGAGFSGCERYFLCAYILCL
jgi:hypothetical protein